MTPNKSSILAASAVVALATSGIPYPSAAAEGRRNVIIFVADGLRAGSVNASDAPTLDRLQHQGVRFASPHAGYPTVTTANASVIATGHTPGDTSDMGNALYFGYPLFKPAASGTATPFIENDAVLRNLDQHFGGNYLTEDTLLAEARASGYHTASIGKHGPTLIQDVTQNNPDPKTGAVPVPITIIVDDATGTPAGVPLDPVVVTALTSKKLPVQAPNRDNDAPQSARSANSYQGYQGPSAATTNPDASLLQKANSYAGDNEHPGTLAANVKQQKYFADVLTEVLLPLFNTDDRPFLVVFWSRDPDGTQHNQGDSLNSLVPGINGQTSRAAVRNCDRNLEQILSTLRELRLDRNTDIFVTADHGFDTISRCRIDALGTPTESYAASWIYYDATGRQEVNQGYLPPGFLAIDLAHFLQEPLYDPDTLTGTLYGYKLVDPTRGRPTADVLQRPLYGNGLIGGTGQALPTTDARVIVAANGGSDLIYLTGRVGSEVKLLRRIVDFLTRQDYVSGVFANDEYGEAAGALKFSDIGLLGNAASPGHLPMPAVIVNFTSFATDPANPKQTGVIVADTPLQEGQGNHGAFDRAATLNFMAACGPDFKSNYVDAAPVSTADVAPTLASLLGFKRSPRGKLSGRIIEEACAGRPDADAQQVKSLSSMSGQALNGLRTLLNWQEYHGYRYFDAAGFPGRTLGLQPYRE